MATANAKRHPGNFQDLTGREFGRLTVLRLAESRHWKVYWLCRCACGKEYPVAATSLRSGQISCGCHRNESRVKHGKSTIPEYKVWCAMKQRCANPKYRQFADYGGRGIAVCEQWSRFENFYADMGRRPSGQHTLERKDNDGNYEPSNCVWATMKSQMNNTRRNHFITVDGVTHTLTGWAVLLGTSTGTITSRLRTGWSERDAVTTPLRGTSKAVA